MVSWFCFSLKRAGRKPLRRVMPSRLAIGSTSRQTHGIIQLVAIIRIHPKVELAKRMKARLAGFVEGDGLRKFVLYSKYTFY